MTNTKEILNRLRALRKEKELRQEYVARQLGIDRTTYVRKERGLIPITTEEWLKLANTMDKDPSYFFESPASTDKKGVESPDEMFILKLYRSLSMEDKRDLLSFIRLILRVTEKKGVKETLKKLIDA